MYPKLRLWSSPQAQTKNRDKIFQWRSVAGFGQQDGFQAYITVKGCNSPTRDTTTSTTTET